MTVVLSLSVDGFEFALPDTESVVLIDELDDVFWLSLEPVLLWFEVSNLTTFPIVLGDTRDSSVGEKADLPNTIAMIHHAPPLLQSSYIIYAIFLSVKY